MDLYEYLFEKLNLKLSKVIDRRSNIQLISYTLTFKNKIVWKYVAYDSVKPLFKYLVNSEHPCNWSVNLIPVVNLLRQFPEELESKEHVDMLLILNGLNEI